MPMEDFSKPSADVSDLEALEKEVPPQDTGDEYERHQNATSKESVGNYVSTLYSAGIFLFAKRG
jgi:hypothetical protein